MEKEENLSDKITTEIFVGDGCIDESDYPILTSEDVKEFIKKLKGDITTFGGVARRRELAFINGIIDKLAGDKLI